MLEGLDDIQWEKLSHAYGSAKDVPALIRALTSSPQTTDESGPLWELFGNIWHQGTVYEASGYAVPFLLEVAENEKTPDRAGVLSLVGAIASGNPYTKKCNARSVVEENLDRLINIAGCTTGATRLAAAYVLAQFPEDIEKIRKVIFSGFYDEPRSLYKAGYIILLGKILDNSTEAKTLILETLKSDDPVQKPAAMLAAASLNIQHLPASVLDQLSDYDLAAELEERLEGLPWDVLEEFDEDVVLEYVETFG